MTREEEARIVFLAIEYLHKHGWPIEKVVEVANPEDEVEFDDA